MSQKKIKLFSSPCQIAQLESFVKRLSDEYSISPDVYPNILISLTEAVNNAIHHGNQNDKRKYVRISISQKKKSVTFKISDEGNGFNPKELPDPTSAERIECSGGRGVYIMKSLCDDMRYKENGRTVLLKFNI